MSNLQLVKQDHLLLKPNVLDEVKENVFKVVNASIAQCYAHLNFPVPKEGNYLVNEVTESIMNKFPTLRTAEIPIAFQNGIRNKYGEFFGLSVISFEKFITGYMESEERANLVKEKGKILLGAKTEPTAHEKFTTGKQLCIDLFERFKSSGQFDRTLSAVYEFLKPLELIHSDYKKGIYKGAMEETVIDKKREVALCTDIYKRRRLNTELEVFIDNISKDMLTTEQHNDVLRTGRKIILKNWFNDLILEETDLSELIESKRP